MLLPTFRNYIHLAATFLIVVTCIRHSVQQDDESSTTSTSTTPASTMLASPRLSLSSPRRVPPSTPQRLSFSSPQRVSFSSPRDPSSSTPFFNQSMVPFPVGPPSLDPVSGVQCLHIPSRAFSRLSTEILHEVTFHHPGPPPDIQPFAAYGHAPYWFLNKGAGWEVRIIPDVGLSYNNLVGWWPGLRQSVIRIVVACVDKYGLGGRQRFVWRNSVDFTNPDTRIEVQVWRGATQLPVNQPPQKFCVIC